MPTRYDLVQKLGAMRVTDRVQPMLQVCKAPQGVVLRRTDFQLKGPARIKRWYTYVVFRDLHRARAAIKSTYPHLTRRDRITSDAPQIVETWL